MRTRKGKKMASILLSISMVAAALAPQAVVYADSTRVVTLGADLSEERQAAILKYFGVNGSSVETIYVTNTDERNLLGSFIPLDVIGTRTLSCAYVNPTKSGGIQVKTANLTWVTSNMIASALSTSGVTNCEVIAACPIPVSGTGALAGVLKAYEHAAGQVLDATRKEIAAQEIVTTGEIAEVLGQDEATQIVNQIKIQVIEDEVDSYDEDAIQAIVDEAVERAIEEIQMERDELVELNAEQRDQLEQLAQKIAEQSYNYDEVKETLQRVEQNVSNQTAGDVNVNVNVNNTSEGGNASSTSQGGDASASTGDSQTELAADSILLNTDDSALGGDVITDATTVEAVTPTEAPVQPAEDSPFEIMTTDEGTFGEDGSAQEPAATEPAQDPYVEELPTDTPDATVEELPTDTTETQWVDETVTEWPTDETVTEQPTDETVTELPTDEPSADISAEPDGEDTGDTDEGTGDETGDATGEDWRADEPAEEPVAAALPQLKVGGNDKTFNGFALKLYTDSEVVPSSGTVTITDANGGETRIDLSENGAYGILPVEDSWVLDELGFEEAYEIFVLTDRSGIAEEGQYHVTADVVFADADDELEPIAGTEKDAVTAEADVSFIGSGLVPLRPESNYVAPTAITLRAYAPEGTVSAEISSTDDSVAVPGIYTADETSGLVDVDLVESGEASIIVSYFDENGESLGQDSIDIAAF